MRKNESDLVFKIGILLLLAYIYMNNEAEIKNILGNIQFSIGNVAGSAGLGYDLSQLPNSPANPTLGSAYNLDLTIYPNPLCAGETLNGRVDSNMPYATCWTIFNAGNGWKLLETFSLSASGTYYESQPVNTPGTAYIRTICCDRNQVCTYSDQLTLNVIVCSDPSPDDSADSDSDDSSSDSNDNVPAQYPCGSIVNPTSQTYCSLGYCTTGTTCTFHSATLVAPAYCGCG